MGNDYKARPCSVGIIGADYMLTCMDMQTTIHI